MVQRKRKVKRLPNPVARNLNRNKPIIIKDKRDDKLLKQLDKESKDTDE